MVFIALLVSLSGCTRVQEAPEILVLATARDVGSLLPVVAAGVHEVEVADLLYARTVDPSFDCRITYGPGLLRSWTWSEDGTVLRAEVSDELVFADGAPVTAHDVAFTWSLVADPAIASPLAPYVAHMALDARPRVVDDTHLEWRFTRAYDRSLQLLHAAGTPALPRHLLRDADRATLRGHRLSREPVGSGPWRIAAREPGVRLVLEPSPSFAGPAARRAGVDRIVFRVMPEYTTRLMALERGELDLLTSVRVEDLGRLRAIPELRVRRGPARATDLIAWNTRRPLFADARVRQALAHAIDVDGLIARLFAEPGQPPWAVRALGAVTPALCGAQPEVAPLAFDRARARVLLDEAGWVDSDGDGVRDRDGVPFRFALQASSDGVLGQRVATVVQAELRAVGIDMEVSFSAAQTFFAALLAFDFDAALFGMSGSLVLDPGDFAGMVDGAPHPYNFSGWVDQEVEAWAAEALAATDPADVERIVRQIGARRHAAQPELRLWWKHGVVVVHERLEELPVDALGPMHHLSGFRPAHP